MTLNINLVSTTKVEEIRWHLCFSANLIINGRSQKTKGKGLSAWGHEVIITFSVEKLFLEIQLWFKCHGIMKFNLHHNWKTFCPHRSESLLTFILKTTDERKPQGHLDQHQKQHSKVAIIFILATYEMYHFSLSCVSR